MRNKLGVIGFPLNNSFSPEIQKIAINEFNLNLTYGKWPIKKNKLSLFINGIKNKNSSILGINITNPYKEEIIPLLDELTSTAFNIGAVNTVKYTDGKLIGDNTDGRGFIKSLLSKKIKIKDKKFLLIGTGGAAKAIGTSLNEFGVRNIDIVGRNKISGNCLIEKIRKSKGLKSRFYYIEDIFNINISSYDLIIQATSLGMKSNNKKLFFPFPFNKLIKNQILVDIIYNPLTTDFLRNGEKMGLKTINGISMLIEQAVLSFEFWTDKKANRNNIYRILGNKI